MDMNNTNSGRKKRRKRDTDSLAAQLAPLEEQNKPAAEQQVGHRVDATDPHIGSIIVDSDHLKVGKGFVETEEEKQFLGMEPVVLVVLILMLIFIGFIAWQISLMPAR